jgi:hypothetical protein
MFNKAMFHITLRSGNKKTGSIPVSISPQKTCPQSCPIKNICYAKHGPLSWHWNRVSQSLLGTSWKTFLQSIRRLPIGQLWRYAQAGDLPGLGDHINAKALRELVRANKGKKGFAYTHKPVLNNERNAQLIREANARGFRINLSANSLHEADKLFDLGIGPVVTLLSPETREATKTPKGRRVIICPAYTAGLTCKKCQICSKERQAIVGFPVHGPAKGRWSPPRIEDQETN